jgi:ABC-type hemin transport system ATPase subunit
MLKKEDRILIRTSLTEYRNLLFKAFKGTEEEKLQIARVNRLLQNWKAN